MEKHCPRCNKVFICRNDDVMQCDCLRVPLGPEDFHYIGHRYSDCLCVDCLLELQKERVACSSGHSFD